MKKIIIPIAVIAIVALAAMYMFRGGNQVSEVTPTPSPVASVSASPLSSTTSTVSPTSSPTASPKPTGASTVKTFTIIGQSFSFTPSSITVNKGDTVKIIFQNSGGNHDWTIDEFNAHTNIIGSGESQTIQFVADKIGTFEYYCSVGTHRQMGMRGNLIVK